MVVPLSLRTSLITQRPEQYWDLSETDEEAEKDNSNGGNTVSQPKRKKRSLSLFPSMPLDIVLEVLSHLSPGDLFRVSRSCKGFHDFLLSREHGQKLWKMSFQGNPGVPQCPESLIEPSWAELLFGDSVCQLCGQPENNLKPDFALLVRGCQPCMEKNLECLAKPQIEDAEVNTHLDPYKNTHIYPHTNRPISKCKREAATSGCVHVWKDDMEKTQHEIHSLRKRVRSKQTGARKELKKYITERIALASARSELAAFSQSWCDKAAREGRQRKWLRQSAIRDRLSKLGYDHRDIQHAWHRILQSVPEVDSEKSLSERSWLRIQAQVEPIVVESQRIRVVERHGSVTRSREIMVDILYTEYKKTLVPAQWAYLPRLTEILEFEEFARLIDMPAHNEADEADYWEAIQKLPRLIADWTEERKCKLLSLLPPASGGEPSNLPPSYHQSPYDQGLFRVELATSVFTCITDMCVKNKSSYNNGRPNPLIGWEAAASHGCMVVRKHFPTDVETRLVFSERGSLAVSSLLDLVGLDPHTTVPRDLDTLDERFLCERCPPTIHMGSKHRKAYPWRECVFHFMENEPSESHLTPQWILLPLEATVSIKDLEGCDPAEYDQAWSCNRCPRFLTEPVALSVVHQHLKSEHAIEQAMDFDYVFREGRKRSTRKAVMFRQTST